MKVFITGATSYIGSGLAQDQALKTMGPDSEPVLLDRVLDPSKAERQLARKANHSGFIPEAESYYLDWKVWRVEQELSHASA